MATLKPAASLLFLALLMTGQKSDQATERRLNGLSLEQLGNVELASVSKDPVKVLRTPAERFEVNLGRGAAGGIESELEFGQAGRRGAKKSVGWRIG